MLCKRLIVAFPAVAAVAWVAAVNAAVGAVEAILERSLVIVGDSGRVGTAFGGLSDLTPAAGRRGRFWMTTDRGPNGTADVAGTKRRTLLDPAFVPTLIEIDFADDGSRNTRVIRSIPLAGRSGRPLSGRPNGVGRDEPIFDAVRGTPLPPDPDGVDTEGVVQMPDGTFWMAEEYRPSLLRVSATGRVLERFVPEGTRLDGADCDVHDKLPAAYSKRRDNRGFESIASSPDGKRLFAMLQSPLDNGKAKQVGKAGNVRLLVFDPAAGKPAAEHVYRLGDPADSDFLTKGAAPADGKICALAAIDAETLLVIEQDDAGLARLYRAGLDDATDTLGWKPRGSGDTLEETRDLRAAGIRPIVKTLVADLEALVPRMRRDVYGDAAASNGLPLKVEGMAILGPDRIALVNDNDFGVHVKPGSECRSCLWVIRLP